MSFTTNPSITGVGSTTNLPIFTPTSNNYAGIMAAVTTAQAAGGGIIQLQPVTYNIGNNTLPILAGIVYQGAFWVPYYTQQIVDNNTVQTLSGTIINGDGTAPAFAGNSTDLGSFPGINNTLSGTGIFNVSITNCTYGIKIGAINNPGSAYSQFINILVIGASLWGTWFENMIHTRYDQITTLNCGTSASSTVAAGGQRYLSSVNGYANCDIGTICNSAPSNLLARGIEMRGRNSAVGAGINTIARIQSNRFNNPTFTPQSVTSNGTTSLAVADGTKFAPDLPIVFTSVGTSGLTVNLVYVVKSVSGNTITISDQICNAALTVTAGTLTVNQLGFACWGMYAEQANSGFGVGNVGYIDMEAGGTTKIYASYSIGVLNIQGMLARDSYSVVDVTLRNCIFDMLILPQGLYFDLDGPSAVQSFGRGNHPAYLTNQSQQLPFWGNDPAAPQGANRVLNLSTNSTVGQCTLYNQSTGQGGDWTVPGVPLGVVQNYSTATSAGFAEGPGGGGFLVYTGSGATTWTFGGGFLSKVKGFRQTIKNMGTGALTVTLNTAYNSGDGTFDGMTGGTSSGKSMLLAAPTTVTAGGCITMVCCQTGSSTYVWCIESMINATLV